MRLPVGDMALQIEFHLQCAGLPRLTRADDPDQTSEVFSLPHFHQPFGTAGKDDTMSKLILCDEPAPEVCPEVFQLAVSNWIDASNVGDGEPRLPLPARSAALELSISRRANTGVSDRV